jgi:hypothetical protein
MKKILFILFLFCSVVQAQTTWYISPSPTGNDGTGDGTAGSPWATLYKATSTVPALQGAPGDIIHVNAGTYLEMVHSHLEPDISLEGEGYNSLIRSHYQATGAYDGVLQLSGGTNTAQHISHIRFDGDNLFGYKAIGIYNRNNVEIYSCFFDNFYYTGVEWGGTSERTGNKFYNNTMNNCGGCIPAFSTKGHYYNLCITQQTGMKVYNNVIIQNQRADGSNGGGVRSSYDVGHFDDIEFYGNTIITQTNNTANWVFAVEFWYVKKMSFHDNLISGTIDFGKDITPGGYSYGLDFYNNTVGWSTLQAADKIGIECEQTADGVNIHHNTFYNLAQPIYFCQYKYTDDYVKDIYIYSNKAFGIGQSGTTRGWGVRFQNGTNADDESVCQYYDNLNIINNTFVSHATYKGNYGILLPTQANTSGVTDLTVKNNIVQGFNSYAIYGYQQDNDYSQSIAGLNITYNDLYGNGTNAAYFSGFTPDPYTSTPNITTIPGFRSETDFRLQSGSGNIWTGVLIGAPVLTDFAGTSFHNPPSIGCYEYTAGGAVVPTLTTSAIFDIEATTATGGGNITSDGGAAVTDRGVCWTVGATPTIANTHTSDGTGTGGFVSSITGLDNGVTYTVRAYAVNSVGTGYGQLRYFTSGSAATGGIGVIKGSGRLFKHLNRPIKIE